MPHGFPLHVDVMAQCFCCRSLQPFRFASSSDQVVCPFCQKHLGSDKAERRDLEHIKMWSELVDDEQETHREYVAGAEATADADSAAIARLTAQVEQLSSVVAGEFDRTETGGVRELIETTVVRRAERNTELAHRQIDRLMAVLWRLDRLHHEDPERALHCVCGKSAAVCPENAALEPERTRLREWEQRNLALRDAGKRHALPLRAIAEP
ncbi:hypothetical protein B0I08_10584 [Glaciihabitans tibetensis]|uniref:Uncharacterized protein n=1 Tax=Glaciihabitans tibetensis TaxID=1266600 RepID=A0A2T0VCM1_9MICO|nr:hypothetical protein [Glaciihabitans tibetensis]PRY67923.1 hypothetical protein B0I08_10584 [Glaciihabitans tibetensis]